MTRIIGARVRSLRESKDWTQGQLAYKAQTTDGQISRIENDERPGAQAVVIGRLAMALGTTTDYLLGNTDDPYPPIPDGDYPPEILRMGMDLIAKWDEIAKRGGMEDLRELWEVAMFQGELGIARAKLKQREKGFDKEENPITLKPA